MSGKKMVIVAGVLGVVSFGGAFVLTQMFRPAPAPDAQGPTTSQQAANLALSGLESMQMSVRESKLENLTSELNRQKMDLSKRSRQLDNRERQIKVAAGQLAEAARDLESMRLQLAAPLVRLKSLKESLEQTRLTISREETTNLKGIAKTYEQMSTESSSKVIEAMCTGNQIRDAAKILQFMSDRGRAKLLSSLSDQSLTARLFDMMKTIRQEEG